MSKHVFYYHGNYMQSRSTLLQEQFGISKEDIIIEFGEYLNTNSKSYSTKSFDEFESIFRENMRENKINSILD